MEIWQLQHQQVKPPHIYLIYCTLTYLDRFNSYLYCFSLGGITGKYRGRIGDTPILGGGTFCNEYGGVSTTGHGNIFIYISIF